MRGPAVPKPTFTDSPSAARDSPIHRTDAPNLRRRPALLREITKTTRVRELTKASLEKTSKVLAHQATVPWPELYQIEQDLLISLAMRAIFSDKFLRTQVAMRGGTVLHKVHLAPAARYSEDIDLVVFGDRPEEHVRKGLMRVLRPIFGREQSWAWTHLKLAVRNAARKSRILRCIYKVPSVAEPGRTLTIEVETNVSERTPHLESTCRDVICVRRCAARFGW